MELHLVQILVVVANIQMRSLKTEVEKGSMRTAFGHGSVDPQTPVNILCSSRDFCVSLLLGLSLVESVLLHGRVDLTEEGLERGENQETEEAKRSRRCRKGIRSTFLNWDKDEIVTKQVWQHN